MIARIRGAHASGRIVLHTSVNKSEQYELPDRHLEDGDSLVVPFKPDTVQVLGSVFNPQAFLFQSRLKAGQYLSRAGGPNRDADRKRVFAYVPMAPYQAPTPLRLFLPADWISTTFNQATVS